MDNYLDKIPINTVLAALTFPAINILGEYTFSPILIEPQTIAPLWDKPTTSLVFTSSLALKAASDIILVANTKTWPSTPAIITEIPSFLVSPTITSLVYL